MFILVLLKIELLFSFNLIAQNFEITDTLKANVSNISIKSDSIFSVEGQVVGLDSGSIKLYSQKNGNSIFIPFREGRFYFSGYVKSLEQMNFLVNKDYYVNSFYLEPGNIKIKYFYQKKFVASGTTENNLFNYFTDTINKINTERFWDLSNKIESASTNGNLDLYLNLVDSFSLVEKDFFIAVDNAIRQNKIGDYLLSYINYFYISSGNFEERMAIFRHLPERLKISESGKKALAFLEEAIKKENFNLPAYKFSLYNNRGKVVNLDKFNGKTIVLDFWASWCSPCIKVLPLLKKLKSNPIAADVVFISVSIDKNQDSWQRMEKELKVPWYSVLANKKTIEMYNMTSVPTYVVIDSKMNIVKKSSAISTLYLTLKELKK